MNTVDRNSGAGGCYGFSEGQRTDGRAGRKASEKSVPGRETAGGNVSGGRAAGGEESGKGAFAAKVTAVMENAAAENAPETAEAAARNAPETAEAAAGGDCAAAAAPGSSRDMSLEEYARYIYGQISELSRKNYSSGNSVFIYISEEGFRAMQNDPEYEAWVMQNIREAYYHAGHRGGHDGYHSAHFFGATREEYRGQSWSFGCSKCEQERRLELKRRRKKQLQALLQKRREQKLLEKQRLEKMYLEKRRLEKSVYKKLLVKKAAEQDRLEERHRKESLARREAASAFRMYMAVSKYKEQFPE